MNDDGIASTLTHPFRSDGPDPRDRAIEDALTHFHIGQEAANALLPVDWWYISRRMRDALLAADADAADDAEQVQEPAE